MTGRVAAGYGSAASSQPKNAGPDLQGDLELAADFSTNKKGVKHSTPPQWGGYRQGGSHHAHPEAGPYSNKGRDRLHIAAIAPTMVSGLGLILMPSVAELWKLQSQCPEVQFSLFDYADGYGSNVAIIEYLLESGADVNKQDRDGWSVLHHLYDCDNVGTFQTLLGYGANPWLKNSEGKTILDLLDEPKVFDLDDIDLVKQVLRLVPQTDTRN